MVLRDCVWLTDTHTLPFSPTYPYGHRPQNNRGNMEKQIGREGKLAEASREEFKGRKSEK
jgi:hypothetical protein